MYERLFNSINARVALTPEIFDTFKHRFVLKKLKKRQYFLQQEDVARYLGFVNSGALRLFTIDERGNDISVQFALEGWWITDNYSFFNSLPTQYNIEALEDCEVLVISKQDYDELLAGFPVFETYHRILLQNYYVTSQRRIIGFLSQSAEEKYLTLAKTYPGFLQRIPQHMIASYLGVTPETLSRVRKQLLLQKG
jgi:CRP-like cAMP-binding protein